MLDRAAAVAPLSTWLAGKMPQAKNLKVLGITAPKGGGNSAETSLVDLSYELDGMERRESLVIRRQMENTDLFLESDLRLPWRVMEALGKSPVVPVPKLVGIEMDRDVLGSPFFVMRKVEGRIVPQFPNYHLEGWLFDLPGERQALVWRNGIEAMAQIHKLDWRENFQFLNRPEKGEPGIGQYLILMEEWYRWAAAGRVQPVVDVALDYLKRNKPANASAGLVWGDAIPANLLYAADQSVAAVIDWENATLGPGEVDLGNWLVFDDLFTIGFGAPRLPALPSRAETIAIYEEAMGRKAVDVGYFEMVALVRLSLITTRQADRQVALGRIPKESKAYLNNPTTAQIAAKLGLPIPEVGGDFEAMMTAATSHQR